MYIVKMWQNTIQMYKAKKKHSVLIKYLFRR